MKLKETTVWGRFLSMKSIEYYISKMKCNENTKSVILFIVCITYIYENFRIRNSLLRLIFFAMSTL